MKSKDCGKLYGSLVSLLRIGDAAGDGTDLSGLASCTPDLDCVLVSSGSKSSSRSSRGSSRSAEEIRLFTDMGRFILLTVNTKNYSHTKNTQVQIHLTVLCYQFIRHNCTIYTTPIK